MIPGTSYSSMTEVEQTLFKLISENDHKNLLAFLTKHKQGINVVGMVESRGYSLLAFSAFKHHTQCFKIVYEHGIFYNL